MSARSTLKGGNGDAMRVSNPRRLLDWYDANRRDLPWRAVPSVAADPYAVWLSEIMLQQTTVATVKGYFSRFLGQWPTVKDLAAAPESEILKAWAGLGYYARARNLHACARTVAADFGGVFPDTEAGLLKLPGIGPYTAAAIAAIAFGRHAVVVDGNVERVVARLYAIEDELPRAKPAIRVKAAAMTPPVRPGDFAQAMMDLGATICKPRAPVCTACPFSPDCRASASGNPEAYPRKPTKKIRPRRFGAVFSVFRPDGSVLLRSRPPRGLLGGMTEAPGTQWQDAPPVEPYRFAPIAAEWRSESGEIEHVFTHFALTLQVFVGIVGATTLPPAGMWWSAPDDIDREALPTVFRKAIAEARRIRDDRAQLLPFGTRASTTESVNG